MRLHRIRVENVRGLAAAEVAFATDGVTVVEAPNESGKTSLFDALDHLLTEKDSTRKQPVRDLQPVGRDVGSLVEAELTCGDVQLTIRKRFNKDRKTELEIHAPVRRQLTGDDAHDELCRILGEQADLPLYEALRFRQGRSLDSLLLADSSSLAARLDEIAGGAGDQADDVLLDRVGAEFERYHTPSGQPGRQLKESQAAVQASEDAVTALSERAQELQRDADELTSLERERRELVAAIAVLEPALAEHRQRRERVRTVREELSTLSAQANLADLEVERAERHLDDRSRLLTTIADDRREQVRMAPLVEQARQRSAELEDVLAGRAEEVEAAERRELEERGRTTALRAAAELGRVRDDLRALEERQTAIDAALDAAATAEAALEAQPLSDEQLDEIRAADDALRLGQLRLGDAAPVVLVRALADVTVTVDDELRPLVAGRSLERAVSDLTVLRIADLAEVELRPGTSLADRQDEVEVASLRLQRACAAVAVPDRAAAELLAEEHRSRLRVLEERDVAVTRALAGWTREELADRIRARQHRLRQLEADVSGVGATHQLAFDVDAAADQLAQQELAEAEARQRATRARTEHATLADEVNQLRRDLQAVELQLEAVERRLTDHEQQLATARLERSDDALRTALETAGGQADAAHAALAASRDELDRLAADEVELLAENAEDRMRRTGDELARVRDELTERRTRIEVRGGEGVGERLLAAEAERDRVRAAHLRLVARADAARELYEAFHRARDAAYAAYREPLRDRLVRTGRVVFGDSLDVELDEQLRIVSRTLDGSVLEWDRLSAGAREQLAILTALAAADLAGGDGGGGVPLVLDDTLGYTDPVRLERLCAVLGAVRGPQVIVLTCVGARFQGVGQATVVRLRETLTA
jgi:hypothetical protein